MVSKSSDQKWRLKFFRFQNYDISFHSKNIPPFNKKPSNLKYNRRRKKF